MVCGGSLRAFLWRWGWREGRAWCSRGLRDTTAGGREAGFRAEEAAWRGTDGEKEQKHQQLWRKETEK